MPAAREEDLYHLDAAALQQLTAMPGSLGEAIAELEGSELMRRALGDHLYSHYLEAKHQEWDDYRLSVSQWELDRYLTQY